MSEAQALIGVDQVARIKSHLDALYTEDEVEAMLGRLLVRLEEFARAHPELRDAPTAFPLDQTDVILITYGDQVREPDKAPLRSLDEFLTTHVHGFVSGVHILPFYPYTSDDGFSVVDYLAVDPALGEWRDIARIAGHFRLMADAVINHVSVSSDWFQAFRAGDERYRDYFIVVAPATDLSAVTRPRALPLLTPVETDRGREYVWTTFSEDQIDLNYATPDVLLGMTGVLLEYVAHGAQILRLDAIAYLWKQIGTACIHLPRTHHVVKFWRAVLDAVAPRTLLITETNVPHDENVSYFGDGSDEAQMVYQFSLPPLTLHALHTGDASTLQRWAAGLHTPSDRTTFFNFLASHDGIGVCPAEGILSPAELQGLVDLAEAHGGYVSYKSNPDGSQSPYELNVGYFDAINDPASDEPLALQVDRFMVAQAILLAFKGVPGIYVHSLFGSRSWREGVALTGRYRTINRQKFERGKVEAELARPDSLRFQVFARYRALLRARVAEPAFHPQGRQRILETDPALFCFVRSAPDESSHVICIHNVSGKERGFRLPLSGLDLGGRKVFTDLISAERYEFSSDESLAIIVPAYGVAWLRAH